MKYIHLLLEYNIKDYIEQIYPSINTDEIADKAIETLIKYFDQNNIKLKREPRFIGMGSYGILYKLPNNQVFKITTDESEGQIAKKLEGKKLKHVAFIYLCKKLGDEIYLIIREYGQLPRLSNKIKELLKNCPTKYKELKIYLEKNASKHPIVKDILKGLLELEQYGIKLYDIRHGNIMKFGKTYKITDLGCVNPS